MHILPGFPFLNRVDCASLSKEEMGRDLRDLIPRQGTLESYNEESRFSKSTNRSSVDFLLLLLFSASKAGYFPYEGGSKPHGTKGRKAEGFSGEARPFF
jgi:hypothetical protein